MKNTKFNSVFSSSDDSSSTEERHYWLGLYKMTASPFSPFYWYATRWLDGSPSSFRYFAADFWQHKYANCIYYAPDGWHDAQCEVAYYFTCKQDAGARP